MPSTRSSAYDGWRRGSIGAIMTVLVALIPTVPAAGAPPRPADARPAAADSGRVITLVTGDRVRVTGRDGQPSYELMRGSPSYGDSPLIFGSGEATYVIPAMSDEARDRLDYSMFDVTALAKEGDDAVPVTVRFERGTQPRDLPGIDVEAGAAERTPDGAYVADASYVPVEAGVDPATWSGVASVRLARSPDRSGTGKRARKRTLTIKVRGRAGKPVNRADAWVQNVDDGRRFNEPVKVEHGTAQVKVPKGNYSVMVYRSAYLAGRPEFAVKKRRTVRLDLSDATVRHHVSVAEAAAVGTKGWPDMTIARQSEKHGKFYITGDESARLQRMRANLRHGSLGVAVAGYFARDGRRAADVFTLDVEDGIPEDLTYKHDRSDFARVPLRAYADGAPRDGNRARKYIRDDLVGRSEGIPSSGGWARGVDLPAGRTLWLQADEDVTWVRSFSVFAAGWPGERVAFKLRRSYQPGRTEPVRLLRGPIGPGRDRHIDGDKTGTNCTMCRVGANLHGHLPILSGAGSQSRRTIASPAMGSWELRQGGEVLQRGRSSISPNVRLPAGQQPYRLRAVSRMGTLGWRLSPRVSTVWGFSSAKGWRVVPLLMPSYRPPTDLTGRAAAGEVRYRLHLGNLGPLDARVATASMRYSTDDGESWRRAALTRLDKNSFDVSYENPAPTKGQRYVSLQVRAKDDGGRTVKETAIRAYRLHNG